MTKGLSYDPDYRFQARSLLSPPIFATERQIHAAANGKGCGLEIREQLDSAGLRGFRSQLSLLVPAAETFDHSMMLPFEKALVPAASYSSPG